MMPAARSAAGLRKGFRGRAFGKFDDVFQSPGSGGMSAICVFPSFA
jgi:hypothetical protein